MCTVSNGCSRPIKTAILLASALVALLTGCDGTTPSEGPNAKEAGESSAAFLPDTGRILGASEMKTEVEAAIADPDTLRRVAKLTELMRSLRRENVEGAKEAFDADMVRLEPWEIRLFAAGYARIAPEEAMDYVRTWNYPKLSATALDEIIYGWTLAGGADAIADYAERTIIDPAEAAQAKPTEVGKIALPRKGRSLRPNYIISTMVRSLAVAGEQDEVTRILARYPVSDKSNLVLSNAVMGFRRHGVETLESWIQSIPIDTPNDVRARAWSAAIGVQAKMDATVSARWFESEEDRLGPETEPLQGWTTDWAREDPTAAMLWLLERPDSPDRLAAIRSAALFWLKKDGVAASSWLRAELDRPGLLEAVVFPLAQYTMTVDIDEAIALAERIPIRGERIRALKQSLMALAGRDPEAFKAYAETHEIPQKVLDTIEAHHGTKLRAIGMTLFDAEG